MDVTPWLALADRVRKDDSYTYADLARDLTRQLTWHGAVDAAMAMFESKKPTAAEREKARRRLGQLVEKGLLSKREPDSPGDPVRWYPAHPGFRSQQAS